MLLLPGSGQRLAPLSFPPPLLPRLPPPVPGARLPPAVPAHVPRCRAKEHPGRCRQPLPRRGKRGGHGGEKGSTCSPLQSPAVPSEVSGAPLHPPGIWEGGEGGIVAGMTQNRQPSSRWGDSISPCWHSSSWGAAGCPPAVG